MSRQKVNNFYKLISIYLKFSTIALFYFAIAIKSSVAALAGDDVEAEKADTGTSQHLSLAPEVSPVPIASSTDTLHGDRDADQAPPTSPQQLVPAQEATLASQVETVDDLLTPVNPKPAEDATNKIIDYIEYNSPDTDTSFAVVRAYSHISRSQLADHLYKEAYSVFEEGTLNRFLGSQSTKIARLQAEVVRIRAINEELKKENETTVTQWREALEEPVGATNNSTKLLAETAKLRKEVAALRKEDRRKNTIIYSLLIPVTAAASYGAIILIKTLSRR